MEIYSIHEGEKSKYSQLPTTAYTSRSLPHAPRRGSVRSFQICERFNLTRCKLHIAREHQNTEGAKSYGTSITSASTFRLPPPQIESLSIVIILNLSMSTNPSQHCDSLLIDATVPTRSFRLILHTAGAKSTGAWSCGQPPGTMASTPGIQRY